ncbi:MAG: MFS transporter [Simkaniaceae bacterium]
MFRLLKRCWTPLLSIAFLMLGVGYFTTFVSVRMDLDHNSSFLIGIVQAAYYAGFFIGAIRVERYISRMRHIQAYAFFCSLSTCAILLQGLILSPYAWIAVRFVMGFCIASLWVVIESWMLIISPKKQRGRLLAFYLIALHGSQSLSQFFLDFVDTMSLAPFIVTSFLGALSVLPVTSTKGSMPELEEATPENIFKIFNAAPLGVTGCLISGFIAGAVYTFLPVYAQDLQLSVSLIVSTYIAGGLILQWPIGILSDLFARGKILLLICLLTAVFSFPMIFVTSNFLFILGLAFLIGGFSFTIYPVSLALVCDRYSAESITSLTSKMFFAFGLGAVIGPLMVPGFLALFPHIGLFVYLMAISIILVVIGLISMFIRKPVPKEEQENFVALPRNTPIAYELDPRYEEEKK